MAVISTYPDNPAPGNQVELLASDPANHTQSPSGTTQTVKFGTVLGYTSPRLALTWADRITGVDPSGVTDSSAAIAAAQTALGANPYRIAFGQGNYVLNATALVTCKANQGFWGPGSELCTLTWSGSGSLFNASESTFNNSHNAGRFSGFGISGPFGSVATSSGISYGNLQFIKITDVTFSGLPGGAIIGTNPGGGWAEEAHITGIAVSECGAQSGYVFRYNGTSFDYLDLNGIVVVEKNIDVISLTGGAQVQGGQIAIRGNLHGGLTNTGAIIAIERGNAGGTGYLTNVPMAITMECNQGADGGTLGHYTIWMGSSNAVSQFNAFGHLRANAAGANSQGVFNPNFLPVSFAGDTQALDGTAASNGVAMSVIGGTRLSPLNDGFGALYANTVYWQAGDVQTGLLANGAQTLVFSGTDTFVTRGQLHLREPASGTAPAVTFPANSSFSSGGGTPTFASTSHTHVIGCTYLPKENHWVLDYRGFW